MLTFVSLHSQHKLDRLEWMHSKGVLHRDIQLGNICLGLPPNDHTFHMIDFGFSKLYIDPKTKKHIPDTPPQCFIGTVPCYGTICTWLTCYDNRQLLVQQCERPQSRQRYVLSPVSFNFIVLVPLVSLRLRLAASSRRDDLEAAALLFIHVLTPNGLVWTRNGLPKDEKAHDRIKRQKRTTTPDELCRGLPEEFEQFLRYCRRLAFTDQPDYGLWKDKFRQLAKERGFVDIENYVSPLAPVLNGQPLMRAVSVIASPAWLLCMATDTSLYAPPVWVRTTT